MKKLQFIMLSTAAVLLLLSCHGLQPSGTSLVTVTVGGNATASPRVEPATAWVAVKRLLAGAAGGRNSAAIPSAVSNIKVTVSAADMTTIVTTVPVAGLPNVTITIEVPTGAARNFLVEGRDASNTVLYRGQALIDLAGDPVSLAINLNHLTPPAVLYTSPTNSAVNIAINVAIRATFSWPMDTTTITPSTFFLKDPGGTLVPGSVLATAATATFTPAANLAYGASYAATITTGVKDLTGLFLASAYTWTFTVSSDTIPPVFPGLALVSGASPTTAQLSWSAATDNVTPSSGIVYLVYQATTSHGENFATPTYTTPAGATSYQVSGLTPGIIYYFIVRAQDAAGNNDGNTVERSITLLDTTPPSFAGLLSISNSSSSSLQLFWSPAADNVTPSSGIVYLIYQSASPGGEVFSSPTYTMAAGATSYSVTGLLQGTTYYFVVRAMDAAGNIDGNLVELSGRLPDTTPPLFGGLTLVSNVTATTAQLSWTAAVDNVTPPSGIVYLIYQATAPSGENYASISYVTSPGATNYTVPGLTRGVTYYFVVRAEDAAGNIDTNTMERSATPDGTPPTFSGLSLISNITTTSMLLSWPTATDNVTPQSNIVYLIYQATSPGGEVYTAATYTTTPGALSYTVGGLSLGNAYYFVVRAQDAAGNIDGNTVELSGYYPGTYVNVATGIDQTGCGAPANPCQTITFALAQPSNSPNILAAPGVYSSVTASTPGETFPLQLNAGTALLCYGANFSTVIDDVASSGTGSAAVIGASGTSIDGCAFNISVYSTAIADNGSALSMNNSLLRATGTFPHTGVLLTANSTITNSSITGFFFDGVGLGVEITNGNSIVSQCTITGNGSGMGIAGGGPTISGNAINNNSNGLVLSAGAAPPAAGISGNTIDHNGYGIYATGVGTSSIHNNSLSCNTSVDFYLVDPAAAGLDISSNAWDHDGTTTPNGPTIMSNLAGCTPGIDICYNYLLTTAPVFSPPNPAVAGGCL